MPKIRITEVDKTSELQLSSIPNIVYIPGKATSASEPKLFRKASEFVLEKNYDKTTLSYKLATRLLSLGMQVLYEGVEEEESAKPNINWERLQDKTLYDIRFLTTGGYASPELEMVSCAANRGDCVALLDHPQSEEKLPKDNGLSSEGKVTYTTYAQKVRAYFENLGIGEEGSYAAAFTPWFKTSAFGKENQEIPASFGYLLAYARSVMSNPMWYSVAGSFRGTIPELTSVCREYSNAEIEMLQGRAKNAEVELDGKGDNIGNAINTISNVRPDGYIIWGNRTFRNNTEEGLKATSFLNTRVLVTELKKTLFNASRKYTFEQNNDVLWFNFKSQITPLLERMLSGNGIEDYRIVKLKSGKRARLKARITIVPIDAVEDFDLQVELQDSLEVTE